MLFRAIAATAFLLSLGPDQLAVELSNGVSTVGTVANPLVTQGPGTGGAGTVQGPAANGAAYTGFNPFVVAGMVNGNTTGPVQYLMIDAGGRIAARMPDPTGTASRVITGSYFGCTAPVAGGGAAQNIASIEDPNAATVNVYLKRVYVTDAGSALSIAVQLGRTTAITSAGTTLTSQAHRSTDAAVQAVIRSGPTGTMASGFISAALANLGDHDLLQNVGDTKDVVLVANTAVMVASSGTGTGATWVVCFEWDEGTG